MDLPRRLAYVRCRAVLRQDKVVLYADILGYASHPDAAVLRFGDAEAWKGDFRSATKTVTARLDLRSTTPLTVSKEDAAAFDALAAPPIERGEELLKETFETNDRWIDLMSAWRVSGGVLEEHSPAADFAWSVALAPGEGRIFAVLPRAVDETGVTVPETVARGTAARIEIETYTEGRLPLRVTIRDSQGVENKYSDYILATDGKAAIDLPVAKNDPTGDWTVTARELLGGAETRTFFRVAE